MKIILSVIVGGLLFTAFVSLNFEATTGKSIWGCYLRVLHGVNQEQCK